MTSGRRRWKTEIYLFFFGLGLDDFHLLQSFNSTLNHGCFLHIGAETVDEFLLLLNLFLLIYRSLPLPFHSRRTFLNVEGIITLVMI